MANNSPRNWFSISMLLLGLLVGGLGGVVRGDWLGEEAAQEVEARMKEDISELKEVVKEIQRDVKELLVRNN